MAAQKQIALDNHDARPLEAQSPRGRRHHLDQRISDLDSSNANSLKFTGVGDIESAISSDIATVYESSTVLTAPIFLRLGGGVHSERQFGLSEFHGVLPCDGLRKIWRRRCLRTRNFSATTIKIYPAHGLFERRHGDRFRRITIR